MFKCEFCRRKIAHLKKKTGVVIFIFLPTSNYKVKGFCPISLKNYCSDIKFCQGQITHKSKKWEHSFLFVAYCLRKLYPFEKFPYDNQYGNENVVRTICIDRELLPKHESFALGRWHIKKREFSFLFATHCLDELC